MKTISCTSKAGETDSFLIIDCRLKKFLRRTCGVLLELQEGVSFRLTLTFARLHQCLLKVIYHRQLIKRGGYLPCLFSSRWHSRNQHEIKKLEFAKAQKIPCVEPIFKFIRLRYQLQKGLIIPPPILNLHILSPNFNFTMAAGKGRTACISTHLPWKVGCLSKY